MTAFRQPRRSVFYVLTAVPEHESCGEPESCGVYLRRDEAYEAGKWIDRQFGWHHAIQRVSWPARVA